MNKISQAHDLLRAQLLDVQWVKLWYTLTLASVILARGIALIHSKSTVSYAFLFQKPQTIEWGLHRVPISFRNKIVDVAGARPARETSRLSASQCPTIEVRAVRPSMIGTEAPRAQPGTEAPGEPGTGRLCAENGTGAEVPLKTTTAVTDPETARIIGGEVITTERRACRKNAHSVHIVDCMVPYWPKTIVISADQTFSSATVVIRCCFIPAQHTQQPTKFGGLASLPVMPLFKMSEIWARKITCGSVSISGPLREALRQVLPAQQPGRKLPPAAPWSIG